MKRNAAELLHLTITKVDVADDDGDTITYNIESKADKVERSAQGFKQGGKVTFESYYVRPEAFRRGFTGPQSPPMLHVGWSGWVYLDIDPNGNLGPAAYGNSFVFSRNVEVKAERPLGDGKNSEGMPVAKAPNTGRLGEGSQAGQEWSGNSLGLIFCWCPAGTFTMGSPRHEEGRDDDESQVSVRLNRGFWLGKYEVTQADWESLMRTRPWERQEYSQQQKRHAASYVSFYDASQFCRELTTSERSSGRLPAGWSYTLPTEAQWEYACRAGSRTAFHFGNRPTQLNEHAWWGGLFGGGNAKNERHPHNVGAKRGNAWGLHDMHGNVWEWCLDGYHEIRAGGNDPLIENSTDRVTRGGCWGTTAENCRSASRYGISLDYRLYDLGFRLALTQSADSSNEVVEKAKQNRDRALMPIADSAEELGIKLAALRLEIQTILLKKGYADTLEAESEKMLDAAQEISRLVKNGDFEGARKAQLKLLDDAQKYKREVENMPPKP